jgi:mRNA-degrading endonuclease toxin of MazEF toxin-antitoxin module
MTRTKTPRGGVFEIDSGERVGAEVGGLHLWLIISGPEVKKDGLVIGLPLTGLDAMRTNYDVPYGPDDITELRPPVGMSLKKEGQCYVLTSKPRHFSVKRLPETPYGEMSEAVIHSALQRMSSAINASPRRY